METTVPERQGNLTAEEFFEDFQVLAHGAQMAFITAYSLIMAVGMLANSYVLYVILAHAALRTPGNLYIASLMVSDLLVCTFCIPFTLVILLQPTWTLGVVPCKLLPFVQGTSIVVSTATVLAIGLDRYQCVARMHMGGPPVGSRRPLLNVALLWTASSLPVAPFLVYQDVRTFSLPGRAGIHYQMCVEGWPQRYMKDLYTLFFITVQLVAPAVVLWTISARFKRFLDRHLRSGFPDRVVGKERRRNSKVMGMLAAVTVVFAASWLPYHVDALLESFHPALFRDQRQVYLIFGICHAVAMTSVVSNPVMYALLNSNLSRYLRSRNVRPLASQLKRIAVPT